MANEMRIRRNFMYGRLDRQGPNLSAGRTFHLDPSFAKIPVVGATNHFPITFQDVNTGVMEIMYVIAHSANSAAVQLLRGREGTTAVNWPYSSRWVHAPTVRDFYGSGNGTQREMYRGFNYPGAGGRVGARDITVRAFPGDVLLLSMQALVLVGDLYFDFYSIVNGKRVTQFGQAMYPTTRLQSSFTNGLPGGSAYQLEYYTAVDAGAATSGFHNTVGPLQVSGTWIYMVKPADVQPNGNVTVGWYAFGEDTGEPYGALSGDGFNQGNYNYGGHRTTEVWYGCFFVHNTGPRMYPG